MIRQKEPGGSRASRLVSTTRTTFVGFLDGLVKCAYWLLKPDGVIYLSIVV